MIVISPGSFFPGLFTILASYAGCNHLLIIIFFIISIGMRGFKTVGLNLTPMDLSPNFAGTLMSLANGAGAINGILAPYTVGLLTPNVNDWKHEKVVVDRKPYNNLPNIWLGILQAYLSEWRLVFWLCFLFYVLRNIVFCIWGSGEVQKFNDKKSTIDPECNSKLQDEGAVVYKRY